jgi:8-oxo-dGTP diphosphatase
VRQTFSAGGIVLRDARLGREIVLVRRFAQGLWALPKGTPIDEEKPAETARREVEEETGLAVEVDRFAGSIQYQFTRDSVLFRKTVNFYLMHAVGGDFTRHDSEYDAVEWVPVGTALEKMTYNSESSLLRHILSLPADGYRRDGQSSTNVSRQGTERAG